MVLLPWRLEKNIYIIGGYNDNEEYSYLDSVKIFDTSTKTFKDGAPALPIPLSDMSAVLVGKYKVYCR